MSKWRHGWIAMLLLAACGQPAQQESSPGDVSVTQTQPSENGGDSAQIPPVDAALVGAPSTAFTAIEPSEIGISAAPTLDEALSPLLIHGGEEGAGQLHLSVRETANDAVADIVRTNMADDSVSAGHLRVEFRRESDGWYPTNAYRRSLCARGALANQWTAELCP
ncbi:MAG: hypothetical protein AB7Q23_11570 [Hyphomonadaceae bacterium]